MRKIREILRLAKAKNLSPTQIATAASLPRTTVRHYLERAAAAGLTWPLKAKTGKPDVAVIGWARTSQHLEYPDIPVRWIGSKDYAAVRAPTTTSPRANVGTSLPVASLRSL
jgi:hypothetical protein